MSFQDYSLTPASNTTIGASTFIGPNMPRDNVRPALQQLAADGRELYDYATDLVNLAQGDPGANVTAVGLFSQVSAFSIPAGTTLIGTTGHASVEGGTAAYVEDSVATAPNLAAFPNQVGVSSNTRYFALEGYEHRPEQHGVVAGEGDSRAKLRAALNWYRSVRGGGTLKGTPGKTYNVSIASAGDLAGAESYGNLGHLLIPPTENVTFDANGARFRSTTATAAALIMAMMETVRVDEVTGAMAVGASVFTFATAGVASNYAAGDTILWRLEDNPSDTPEPLNWGFAKIASVNTGANTVTMDRKLPRAWDGTDTNNKHIRKVTTSRGQVITGLRQTGTAVDGTTENTTLRLSGLLYPEVPRWQTNGAKVGSYVQFCEGAKFGRHVYEYAVNTGLNTGQGTRWAQSTGKIEELHCRGVERNAVLVEQAADLTIDFLHDIAINPLTGAGTSRCHVTYNSQLTIDTMLLEGAGGCIVKDTATGNGRFRVRTCKVRKDIHEASYPLPGRDCDELSLDIAGTREVYRASDALRYQVLIPAGTGTQLAYFRPGWVTRLVAYFGGGLVAADISNLRMSYDSGTQLLINITPPAAPTQNAVDLTASLAFGTGFVPGAFAARDTYVNPSVTWVGDLRGSGKYLVLDFDIIPDGLRTSAYHYGDSRNVLQSFGYEVPILKAATGSRPGTPFFGEQFLDTTLDADGKPIWYVGTPGWVDATGAVV